MGNDIVDLKLAKIQSNWQRKNYLDKIFTTAEQSLITAAKSPDVIVWLLWSMKESAYKIHNRKTGIRAFAPKSLNCSIYSFTHGEVSIDGDIYFTKSSLNTAFIHTIATHNYNQLDEIKIAIYEAPNHLFDYRSTKPGCVSHHGKYLALVY